MEIAGRNHFVVLKKHHGVVRGTLEFVANGAGQMPQRIPRGTVHLGDAPEGVRILHVGFGPVRSGAAVQPFADPGGHYGLSRLRAGSVHPGIEGLQAAVKRIQGKGGAYVGPVPQGETLGHQPNGMGHHELGPVDQSQSFFGAQFQGLPSQALQGLCGRHRLAFQHHFPLAYQRQTQVGQGGQIAGRTQRTAFVHHREAVGLVEIQQPPNGGRGGTRETVAQRKGFGQQHQANQWGLQGISGTAGVAPNEIQLQLGQVFVSNRNVVQRTKTGINSVMGLLGRLGQLNHVSMALLDVFPSRLRQIHRMRSFGEHFPIGPVQIGS